MIDVHRTSRKLPLIAQLHNFVILFAIKYPLFVEFPGNYLIQNDREKSPKLLLFKRPAMKCIGGADYSPSGDLTAR